MGHGSTKIKLNVDALSFLQKGNETEMKPQGVLENGTKTARNTGERAKLTTKARGNMVVTKNSTLKMHSLVRHAL